jgi:hypothetical protein
VERARIRFSVNGPDVLGVLQEASQLPLVIGACIDTRKKWTSDSKVSISLSARASTRDELTDLGQMVAKKFPTKSVEVAIGTSNVSARGWTSLKKFSTLGSTGLEAGRVMKRLGITRNDLKRAEKQRSSMQYMLSADALEQFSRPQDQAALDSVVELATLDLAASVLDFVRSQHNA